MDFSEKIKQQKKKDKKEFKESQGKISQAALEGRKYRHTKSERYDDQFIDSLNQITDYYKLENIELTREAIEKDEVFDTVLGRTGVTRRKIRLIDKWWVKGYGPVMTQTSSGEVIALIPKLFGGYRYYSHQTGSLVNINKKSAKDISQTGYCFYKPFPNKSLSTKDFIVSIIKTLSSSDVLFLFLVTLISTLLGLVSPQVTRYIFDSVVPSGIITAIYPLAALLVGVVLATTAFGIFQSMWVTRIADKVQFGSQGALWIRILNLPVNFFKDHSAGDLYKRTEALEQICENLSSSLLPTILASVFSFIYLFQISHFAEALLFPSLCIILVMVAFSIIIGYLSAGLNEKANKILPKLSGLVSQLFGGISKIKIAGAEVKAFSKWADLYSQVAEIQFSPQFLLKIASALNTVINISGTIWIYWITSQKNISAADYIAFSAAYGSFSASILQISGIITEIAFLKPAINLLAPILKEAPEVNSEKIRIDKLKGDIETSKLTFKYKDDAPLVIDGLSLKINRGEYVALVGSTGCGKSTFIRLLLGFEKPRGGLITMDNQSLDGLDLHSVRKRMGIVLQNGKLFSDSIFENIVISSPSANLEDAWEAARRAGVEEDIKKMPMNMHTLLGEDGAGLSGGQRQRVMIARALITNPDILIFDEATSALDNISQAMIVETLDKMEITRIIIAHRLSTIKNCDRIIYLDKGKVAEEGTYEELMALNGKFAELAHRQIA